MDGMIVMLGICALLGVLLIQRLFPDRYPPVPGERSRGDGPSGPGLPGGGGDAA